jgi:hypothetical protein
MAELKFNPNKSFGEHVEALRAHIVTLDAECAKILFEKLEMLLGDGDPAQARVRRGNFNAAVVQALEALLAEGDNKP